METKTYPSSSSPSRQSPPITVDDQDPAQSKDTLSLLVPDFSPPEFQSFHCQDDNLAYQSFSQGNLGPDTDRPSLASTTTGTRSFHYSPNRRWRKYDASAASASYGLGSERRSRWRSSGRRNKAAWCQLAQWVAMACLFAGMLGFCLHLNAKVENLQMDRDSGQWRKGGDGEDESTAVMQSRGGQGGDQNDVQGEYDGGKIMQALLTMLEKHPLHHFTPGSTRRRRKRQSQYNQVYQRQEEQVMLFNDQIMNLIEMYQYDMPKVHLSGPTSGLSSDNGPYFLWQTSNSFIPKGVTLHYNRSGLISGIQIDQQGIYLVYSQVIAHGMEESISRHDCSSETVVILYPADGDFDAVKPHEVQVLMSSYLTQDNQGRRYNYPINSSYAYPRDASVQIGLFMLQHQSQVRVRKPNHDDGCRTARFGEGPETSSYFGLYQIAPL